MYETKIGVLGAGGVGKTALTLYYVNNTFISHYDPTIEDSYRKLVEVDGITWHLEIIDTAGTEHFSAMRDLYMSSCEGLLIVYSVTSVSTFYEAINIREQATRVKDSETFPMVLVGNKCDLNEQRGVSTVEGQELAQKWKCVFLEASAQNNYNVKEAFETLVQQVYKSKKHEKDAKKKHRCTIL